MMNFAEMRFGSIAGAKVAARIRREPDETISRIVAGWPQRFDARRATAFGFRAETALADGLATTLGVPRSGRAPKQPVVA